MAGQDSPPSDATDRQQVQDSLKEVKQTGTKTETESSPDDLLQVARAFLEDDEVKKIPHEEKIEYLKSKGLEDGQIHQLLARESSSNDTILTTVHQADSTTRHESSVEASTIPTPSSTPLVRDIPPIITYPEFLLKPQRRPPLVTLSRLTDAVYTIATLSALTYGAARYLIQPAIATLTECRHEFASHTLEGLEKVNDKLEEKVSHVPYIPTRYDDGESVDSDPTELFHRDVGVQTSPPASVTADPEPLPKSPTEYQTEKLSGLLTTINSLTVVSGSTMRTTASVQHTLEDTQAMLDKMESEARRLDYSGMSGVYKSEKVDKHTEAQKFKMEVRSLKGALLGSRSFAAPQVAR